MTARQALTLFVLIVTAVFIAEMAVSCVRIIGYVALGV